ncbi:MAG: hypothetical protein AAGI50_16685 [Pseudomonadota bacterium]
MSEKPFFVGYLPPPPALRSFLIVTILSLLALFGVISLGVATTQPDPGPGRLAGRATVTGVLQTLPYPWVHVTEGTELLPAGTPVLLSALNKAGVQGRTEGLDGALVQVSGVQTLRGDMELLQLRGGTNGLSALDGATPPEMPFEVEDLGRWRVEGEICDGKCYAGAMHPGTGLAHRACANLCLLGGVPPVFVSAAPVAGEDFLLIADADGGPVTDLVLDHVAVYVSVEGRIERRGGLLVFLLDTDTLKALR